LVELVPSCDLNPENYYYYQQQSKKSLESKAEVFEEEESKEDKPMFGLGAIKQEGYSKIDDDFSRPRGVCDPKS